MKIIFLDIDGVMNMFGSSSRTFMKPYGHHIERHLVDRLNYICEKVNNVKIVISSSWRSDMDDLQKQLEQEGFKYWDKVIGKTPKPKAITENKTPPYKLKLEFRGEQIQEWIKQFTKIENECCSVIDKYVVIDDETIDICGEYCNVIPETFVCKTDSNEGMLHKDAIKIIELLNA
jgi:hypothetical protein